MEGAETRRFPQVSPSVLTDSQMVLGMSLIVGVAALCQVIAPRLRMPALVLMLPAGFVLGILVPGANAQEFLGPAFSTIVDLTVAVVLFQGALDLGRRRIDRQDWHTVTRLVFIGGPITWGAGAFLGAVLIGFPTSLATLFGAIIAVSGPTTVGPILDAVRPKARVRNVLTWESVMLDPLGALVAVILFQAIKAGQESSFGASVANFFGGIGIAVVCALIGALILRLGIKFAPRGNLPGTQLLLGTVLLMAGIADSFTENAGLLTALLMGGFTVLLARRHNLVERLSSIAPFFDTIATIAVGVLFVGLSALVTPDSLTPLLVPALITVGILIIVVRPAMVFLVTIGRGFTGRERLFIGWCDPRGIVAAATAASVAGTLVALKVPGAEDLLPVVFIVITVTVFVYGLTLSPLAKALGLSQSAGAKEEASPPPAAPPPSPPSA